MSYFTDNPWPLLIILVTAAIVLLLTGSARARAVAAGCILAAIGLLFLEEYLVSPREEVEQEIEQLLTNFKDRDTTAISRQISSASPGLIDQAERGLDLVDVSDTFHIQDVNVSIEREGARAVATLRANGTLTLRNRSTETRVATYWRTTWEPEDGQWKLREVVRLNPTNGQEMDILSAQ